MTSQPVIRANFVLLFVQLEPPNCEYDVGSVDFQQLREVTRKKKKRMGNVVNSVQVIGNNEKIVIVEGLPTCCLGSNLAPPVDTRSTTGNQG